MANSTKKTAVVKNENVGPLREIGNDIPMPTDDDAPKDSKPAGRKRRKAATLDLLPDEIEKTRVARLVLEGRPPFDMPKLNKAYEVFCPHHGDEPLIYSVDMTRTARLIREATMVAELSKYGEALTGEHRIWRFGRQTASAAVANWAHQEIMQQKILPKRWGFASFGEVCFNRMGYDPIGETVFPSGVGVDWEDEQWREYVRERLKDVAPISLDFLERMDVNWRPFLAKIGASLTHGSDRKQLFWLGGDADAGKSTFIAALGQAFFGTAFMVVTKKLFRDDFYVIDLIDKRFVLFSEVPADFINHEDFLSLLGENVALRARRKGKGSITYDPETTYYVATNPNPTPADKNEIRARLIIGHCTRFTGQKMSPKELTARLMMEVPHLASLALAYYMYDCPRGGPVSCDDDLFASGVDELRATKRGIEEVMMGKHVIIDAETPIAACLTNDHIYAFTKDTRCSFAQFCDYLRDIGHKAVPRKVGGRSVRVWQGLRLHKTGDISVSS